jgi:glycosyltransferase involved in cell wall biosynthesis
VIKAKRLGIKHLHYTVNPGYLSALTTFLSCFFKISLSVSVVDSTKISSADFNLVERMCWKYTLYRALLIDALSPKIKYNLTGILGSGVSSKIRVSPCSFSEDSSKSMRPVNSRDIDLVFAARFVEGKGINLFIETLQILDQMRFSPPLNVHICGQGPLEAIIHRAVKHFNRINVSVYWTENISEVFVRAKVFVSLQQRENYPSQAVLESANQAVAVIATDVGDTRLFLNEENAILVTNTPPEVARAVIELLNDQKLREKLGNSLRRYIKTNHTIERYTEYFIAFLEEINQAQFTERHKGDSK